MSFQWTLIAGCLYVEMAALTVLMLPLAGPRRWSRLFRSSAFNAVRAHFSVYFYVVLAVMALLLFDSVREMTKYSAKDPGHAHITSELKGNVKLFRAQRNFYITSFSIFLAFVIRRFVSMILENADQLESSTRTQNDHQETVKLINEEKASKDMCARIDQEELVRLHEELSQNEQARTTMEQEISDMNAEVLALTTQIKMWKSKYQEVSNEHKARGDQ